MDADLDTLATALYVRTDDLLKAAPEQAPARPRVGIAPRISDAELITLAVMQALLGRTSEARWLRYAHVELRHLFPYLPQQPGHNKRLRGLADTLRWLIAVLARDTTWWTDDVWVVDSTPVKCARSRETVHRSALAGWAEYGYYASTPAGSGGCGYTCCAPWTACRSASPSPAPRPTNASCSRASSPPIPTSPAERAAAQSSPTSSTPAGNSRPTSPPPASRCYARPAPKRSTDLARPCSSRCARSSSRSTTPSKASSTSSDGGHTPTGVWVRVLQRVLALTAAIWHNDHIGAPTPRSLIAYDH